jgi:hypothetical protein
MLWRVGKATVTVLLGSAALAAAPDKQAASVRLPEMLEQSLQAHEALARKAKGSPDDLCKLVDDSYTLFRPLELALIDLTKKVSAKREQRVWDQLDRRTTGMYFVMSDEFSLTGVDYAELARMAAGDNASLLRAMAELDGVSQGFENVPAWQDPMTDHGGCHSPGKATKTLTGLARSWSAASPCMRSALTKPLDERLEQMAADGNFCQGDPTQRISAARENATQMRKLKGTRGPALAGTLVKRAEASDNRPPRPPG